MQKGDYITEEKRKELEIEVEALKGPKRKEIIDALEFAKSLGDLSENAEYHQAREDQGKLEERIVKIEAILKNSTVVTNTGGDTISVGSTVTVQKENSGENKTYTIVGAEEADMAKGKMSNHSPLGEALFGKKKGETITFKTPAGMVNYKIVEVK
ncbi:MAG: transcription elongation factor GreA [Candidatus Nomurabacteria bacterium]|nr:transcription elongation factor GreA [Candidatus Nomurabacteria bacterium]